MIRLGIIGVGGMGSYHINNLPQIQRIKLAAICDIDPAKIERFKDVPAFTDSRELIRSGLVDAVLIATPHYFHTTIGIDSLEQGLHLLTEKPISVHVADCKRLIAAHTNPKQVFAAMFKQRTDPHYIKIRQLIQSGELGEIQRTNWIITDWFRSDAYYAMGGWRATWKGEGGGVLLNQCPHNLDLFQWICGKPSSIRANCSFGKYHDIEVEDEVTAYLEYPNGATGIFITTTGEAPGTNRLEITGDRGRLVCENGKVSFIRNETGTREFCKTTKEAFGLPERWNVDIPVNGSGDQHTGILKNFVAAILDGAPLIAPAEEGIHSVEMANAMLYSSMTGQTVHLPLDAEAYEAKLMQLITESRFEKKTIAPADADLSKSF